jgi:hypothetical protein
VARLTDFLERVLDKRAKDRGLKEVLMGLAPGSSQRITLRCWLGSPGSGSVEAGGVGGPLALPPPTGLGEPSKPRGSRRGLTPVAPRTFVHAAAWQARIGDENPFYACNFCFDAYANT